MNKRKVGQGISKVINKLHGTDNPQPLKEGQGYSTKGAGAEIKKTPQQKEVIKEKVNENLIWVYLQEGKYEEASKLVGGDWNLMSPDQKEIMVEWRKIQQKQALQNSRQKILQEYGITEEDDQRGRILRAQRAQLEQMGKNFASGSGPVTSNILNSVIGNQQTKTPSDPSRSKVNPGEDNPIKKNESEADVLAKTYILMRKHQKLVVKKEKADKKYAKALNNQKETFLNETIEALTGEKISSGKKLVKKSRLAGAMKKSTNKSGFLKYGFMAAAGLGGLLVAKDALANINWGKKFDDTFKDFKFPEFDFKQQKSETQNITLGKGLKEKISGAESLGDYNIMNIVAGSESSSKVRKGNKDAFGKEYTKDLTEMTLEEVMELGKSRGQKFGGGKGAAAGKYQFMPIAIADVGPRAFGKDWKSQKFTEENQEKMMDKLVEHNAKRLKDANIPVTDVNMYMLHFFGNTGQVKKFLATSEKEKMSTVLGPEGSAANKSVSEMTIADYRKSLKKKGFTDEEIGTQNIVKKKTPEVPNIKGIEELTAFTARNPVEARKSNTFGAPRPTHSHQGIDLGRTEGAPVIARETGKVAEIRGRTGYGYTVTLDHGNGYSSFYAHLKELPDLKIGQTIQRGEAFALVGRTVGPKGEKSAKMPIPHLHLEYRKNGIAVDPEEWNIKQSKLIMEERKTNEANLKKEKETKSNDKQVSILNNNTNVIGGGTTYLISQENVSTYSPVTQQQFNYFS
jgi:murein DD-endopeptidase MepM/ murein hydrolase activator NlpD